MSERNQQRVWTDEMRANAIVSDETKALLSALRKNQPWTQARREAYERSRKK